MALNEVTQRRVNARYNAIPLASIILPKQTGRRIPRTVVAIEQPAPVGHKGQQHPDRLSQRTSEVSDAGIHRNHEVQIRYERRSVGEILQFITEIEETHSTFQRYLPLPARILLQTHKRCIDLE